MVVVTVTACLDCMFSHKPALHHMIGKGWMRKRMNSDLDIRTKDVLSSRLKTIRESRGSNLQCGTFSSMFLRYSVKLAQINSLLWTH